MHNYTEEEGPGKAHGCQLPSWHVWVIVWAVIS